MPEDPTITLPAVMIARGMRIYKRTSGPSHERWLAAHGENPVAHAYWRELVDVEDVGGGQLMWTLDGGVRLEIGAGTPVAVLNPIEDMRPKRVEFTVPAATWAQIEEARGGTPRAAWIKQAIDKELARQAKRDASPKRRA